jgi:methylase of polypeptide subunit release factors
MTEAPEVEGPELVQTMAFGPLTISYDHRVLEPRPWTTAQSAWATQLLEHAPEGPVLELCAGAGQIGLLAVAPTDRRLVAVDADPVASMFARSNCGEAGLDDRVEIRTGMLETAVAADERFALVIADPPWVESARVTEFEEDPVTAIDGGSDGLDIARACLRVAAEHLLPGGSVLLQVGGPRQVARIRHEALENAWPGLAPDEHRDHGESGSLLRLDRITAD